MSSVIHSSSQRCLKSLQVCNTAGSWAAPHQHELLTRILQLTYDLLPPSLMSPAGVDYSDAPLTSCDPKVPVSVHSFAVTARDKV